MSIKDKSRFDEWIDEVHKKRDAAMLKSALRDNAITAKAMYNAWFRDEIKSLWLSSGKNPDVMNARYGNAWVSIVDAPSL
jgi:general stress protein 26